MTLRLFFGYNKTMKKGAKKIRVLSLFTGIGGLDIGFHKAGFDIVAATDWDHDCCETLKINSKKYFPGARIVEADVTKLDPKDLYDGKIDFIVGGPPCQSFSAIGRRAGGAMGTLDVRGELFRHYCRLIKHYQPKGFLFENVRGILSSHNGEDWKKIQKEFESLGYVIKFRLLDAAGFGAPQHRERVILVGSKKGNFQFPRPVYGPDSKNSEEYVSPSEALKDVRVKTSGLFPSGGKYDDLLKDIPPGQNYLFYTQEMGHPSPRFAWRSKFSDFLYKAHPNKPVKTIVASLGRYSGPFHWDGRRFDVNEFKVLQGFPKDFELAGSQVSQMKQIGNSVVPPFAYYLAKSVKKTIFGSNTNVELLSDDQKLTFDSRKGEKARQTRRTAVHTKQPSNTPTLFDVAVKKVEPVHNLKTFSKQYFIEYDSALLPKINGHESLRSWKIIENFSQQTGELHIDLSKSSQNHKELIKLNLDFAPNTLGPVKKISASLKTLDVNELYSVWDAINIAIESQSTYPSIHELYGHFTEPNPKFSLSIECSVRKPWPEKLAFLMHFSNFYNVGQLFPIEFLKTLGFKNINDEHRLVQELRLMRFDIRTNLTNKTIPEGMFRCCYPFFLPFNRRSFVTISQKV